jgi:hypothetical protein
MSMTLSGDGTITGLVAGGLPNATVIDADLSLTANSAQVMVALNASGSAPIYACRAWANFNGTGTVAIRASGNVSSITDNGTGDYTVNFTTAMSDANYSVQVNYSTNYGVSFPLGAGLFTNNATALEQAPSTSGFRFVSRGLNNSAYNPKYLVVSIFR